MLSGLQYVLNRCFGGVYFFDFKRFRRMEIEGKTGLKRGKIPQPRQVKSDRFQPGLLKHL